VKLIGTFAVMPLQDLLEWVMAARKAGRLVVERNHANRTLYIRESTVIACSSDDPSLLLGQFLLSQGRISEDELREAMQSQEESGRSLGEILVEKGALRPDQLEMAISEKAAETVYGLFDWPDAAFEFTPDVPPSRWAIPTELPVQEVLLEGIRRTDETARIRSVFSSQGMVFERTERPPDAAMVASPMARRIYRLIDGQRTLAQILLNSHAPEYLASAFLLRLIECGLIRLKEIHEVQGENAPAEGSIERAEELLAHGEYLPAIRILEALAQQDPSQQALARMMLAKAEAAFVASMYRGGLPPESVPVLKKRIEELQQPDLSAEDLFLMDLLDGVWNVKTIVWIAPLRSFQVLRTLQSMLERGMIELRLPQPDGESPTDDGELLLPVPGEEDPVLT